MAKAVSAKSLLRFTCPYFFFSQRSSISKTNCISLRPQIFHQSRLVSQITKFQLLKPSNNKSLEFSGFSLKPINNTRNLQFSSSNVKQGGEMKSSVVVDESEKARGREDQCNMPSWGAMYLNQETLDPPLKCLCLILSALNIYLGRTVLLDLSNWKKGFLAIGRFMGHLSKLTLPLGLDFIETSVTSLTRCMETALYIFRSVYSAIVVAVPELTFLILWTTTLLAIAETEVRGSATSQPYLLTLSGIVSLATVTDFIPELVFRLLLMGIFCFSWFFKRRDLATSLLPVAAALSAVGQFWLRLVVLISYYHIPHHSKKLSKVRNLPAPLLVAALATGIHVAAKWTHFRHLTWMLS